MAGGGDGSRTSRLDRLLSILRCPDCKGALARAGGDQLACGACAATYPLDGEVPVLLKEGSATWSPKLVYRDDVEPGSWKAKLRSIGPLRALVHGYRNLSRFLHLPSDWAPGPHIARMASECVEAAEAQVGLDIGGGSGYYRAAFGAKGCELFVLDIRREAGVEVIGTAYSLPAADNSLDIACLFQVLEHLHDPQKALQECARVLVPGGRVLITAPQFSHIHGWPSDYFRYTRFGLRHLAEVAGLEVLDERPMGGRFSVVVCAIGNCFNMGAGPLRYAPFSLMSYAATLLDRVFDRANRESANPDTVGWACALRKPG